MAFLLSGHVLLISLIFLPVVPCSYGPDLATWMQDGESGVFLEGHSYATIWNNVGRSPVSCTWLCLARKSRSFRCHKTRRHISMMILLLMLSGDVEMNPGPLTGRNQSEQGGLSFQPPTAPHPPHPEPTSPSSTLDDERSRKLKQVHERLKAFYEKQPTVQYAPRFIQFINLAIVRQVDYRVKRKKDVWDFLQATIHGIDGYYYTSKKIEFKNILNCGKVISGKRVVISGAPGCGKTTLSHKLCKDLYSQSLPNQYCLVLLVELRRLRLYMDSYTEDMDLQFLLREFQRVLNLPELCQSLEERDGEGVALVLDGFDEIPDQLGSSPFILELLSCVNPYLSKCDVFVTSCPSRIPNLISLIRFPHRHVEILGFTDTDINEYIKSFFFGVYPNDRCKAKDVSDKVIQHLSGHPLVRGMCRIPRVLEIVCKVQDHIGSDPLPETTGGIYAKYICHELSEHNILSGLQSLKRPIENVLNVPEDQFPGFYPLCEVAYKCCIDRKGQRLILTDNDLGDVKRYLDKRGSIYNLLFSEYVDEISPIVAVLYQLNHKTVQETLAAVHIARQSELEQEMIWKEEFHRPEMGEVWKVYCNLTKLKNVDLKELSYSVLSHRFRNMVHEVFFSNDDKVVMTSLFEADNSSLSREILGDLFKTFITVRMESSYDVQVVRYFLQHHPTLQRLHLWANPHADVVLTDELMPILMQRLRELRCDLLSESDWTTLNMAFAKAQHLETIQLPMYSRSENVETVLSALTKSPALKSFTLKIDSFNFPGSILEDCRRIVEALEANHHLKEFRILNYHSSLSTITEHLCRNETLSEVTIDFSGLYSLDKDDVIVPVQLLKSLLVHREKCTVKMPLIRQQWCAVLSGLRDAKKLKELVMYMLDKSIEFSIPDQYDLCLISSDEVEEMVAASKQLVKVELGLDPSMSEAVGDFMLSMVKGVSRNKNISKLGVVIGRGAIMEKCIYQTRSVVVPILEVLAVPTNHITCVNFEYTAYPLDTLLGDDWCQLLVGGPMFRRECCLRLFLTPPQCGQLLSRVCDAEGLEEFRLIIPFDISASICDDVTVKVVEKVLSSCRLKKIYIQYEACEGLIDYTNLLVAVVRGIAFNNNDIDFVLEGDDLLVDFIMSQLPPQSVERFEVVERLGCGFIISKPCAPTVTKGNSTLQASPPLSPAMNVGVTQTANKSSSPSSTRLSQLPFSSGTKSRIPLPTSSTSSLRTKIGIVSATQESPSLLQLSQTQISSVMNAKSTPSARCIKERGPPTSNPTFQKNSDNEDVIKSHSDLLPYMDKMLAHLTLLGAVLGVEDYTSAIMKEPGDPQSRCIDILCHWIKVTPHPTWTIFCDKLKRTKTFNNLRSKICRDKSC